MKFTTLSSWLNWLEHQPPRQKDNFHLETITIIAKKLNLLPLAKPVISVTGTNGKGSCVAFCEAILTAAGYRVGAYYSPHVFVFNERIKVANNMASDEQICQAFQLIDEARQDVRLSYFEFATLAALIIFQQENVDVLILEIGVGGRLDTVNIVDADVAVITSIALDHLQWLGTTREAIGKEKAGIFRAHQTAVCGDEDIPLSVINMASDLQTKLFRYHHDYHYKINNQSWDWQSHDKTLPDLPLPYLAVNNAATALQALALLAFPLELEHIKSGLQQAWLPGRFQVINKPIMQIFDVAHNPAAALILAQRLQQQSCNGRTIAVVGMMKDKSIAETLSPLIKIIDEWHIATLPSVRAASSAVIAEALLIADPEANIQQFESIQQAQQIALDNAQQQDRIVIFGSFQTVGALCPVNA